MRIISPFRDYYDSAAGYDDEGRPVYVRETAVTRLRGFLSLGYWMGPSQWTAEDGDSAAEFAMRGVESVLHIANDAHWLRDVAPVAVGFCGLIAPAWHWNGRIWWDPAELAKAADEPLSHNGRPGVYAQWPPDDAERAENLAIFRALDCPVFVVSAVGGWTLERNPHLGKLGFMRIVDPYSARQAVEGYLGTELAKQVDPPQLMDDELKRDKKGFDDASFKTPPGGPTRKRKKLKKL